jgi:photosystem II stability/assembly factor-like uncharacterized protein
MATPASTTDVTLEYLRPGIGLIGVAPGIDGDQGSAPPVLYRSVPGGGWRDITPPQARHRVGTDEYVFFESASFLDASTGWVTGFNVASDKVTIDETTNGGSSWTSVPGGVQAGGQSTTQLQLLTNRVAFRDIVEPTAPGVAVAVTGDSGRLWRTVYQGPSPTPGPGELPMTFVNKRDGFSGAGLNALYGDWPLAAPGAVRLYRSTDGGAKWSTLRPPLARAGLSCPAGYPSQGPRSCVYGLPAFFAHHDAVLPTVAETRGHAVVGFDVSRDGGKRWTLEAVRTTTVLPQPHQIGGGPFRYPLVAEASKQSWWVVAGHSPIVTTSVTTSSGRRWTRHRSRLPAPPAALQPINATHAWVSVHVSGTTRIYATANGGATWLPLLLPR